MVAPALCAWNDVIDGEVAERKQDAATGAHPFMPSVERVLARALVRKHSEIGTPGYAPAMNHVVEQAPPRTTPRRPPPRQHETRRPVHHRHQVQEPAAHRNVELAPAGVSGGDVGAPDLVRALHRHAAKQVRIHLVLRMRLAGPRLRAHRLQTHQPHPPAPPVPARDRFHVSFKARNTP